MKTLSNLCLYVILIASIASVASGQQPGPGTPGAQTPPVQSKKGAKKMLASKFTPNQKKAYKFMSGAIRVLEHALPIYDGHRLHAMDLIKNSRHELVDGANDLPVKLKRAHKGAIVNEGHDKGKFAADKVSISQREMANAITQIDSAIKALKEEPPAEFLTNTIESLNAAKKEIAAGIAVQESKPK